MANFDPSALIKEGDKAILKKGRSMQCIQVRSSRKYQLEKLTFNLDGAIGQPFGSTFEVSGNDVTLVKSTANEDLGKDVQVDRDNRDLHDTSENQKLDHTDILQMRSEGVSGHNIIDQLIENSTTFHVKTEYAQQKYLKRKKRKHIPEFTIFKPSTRLLAEMYFNKGPIKICHLRMDSLAQMLMLCNVHAHNKMLVMETCVGLLVGAVMERMGGFGTVVHAHCGDDPTRTAVDHLGFPEHFEKMLYHFPLKELPHVKTGAVEGESAETKQEESGMNPTAGETGKEEEAGVSMETGSTEEEAAAAEVSEKLESDESDPSSEPPTKKSKSETSGDATSEQTKPKHHQQIGWKKQRQLLRAERLKKATEVIKEGNFDGLLVASRVHPTPIVLGLMEYVSPSRPIVIFSQHIEPLLDCQMKLRDTKRVAHLSLTETWWRNYQVLPNRTHPEIQMNNYSGYILSCILTKKLRES